MEQTKIVGSQSSQPHKSSQSTHAGRTKAVGQHSTATDAANASAGGGFFALLTAMGDTADGSVDLVVPDGTQLPAGLMSDSTDVPTDASVLAAWQGLFGTAQSIGTLNGASSAPEGGALATAAAALSGMLAASGAALGNLPNVAGLALSGVAAAGTARGALDGEALEATTKGQGPQTLQLERSADLQDGQIQGAVPGSSKASSRVQGPQAQKMGKSFDVSYAPAGTEMSSKRAIGIEAAAAATTAVVSERAASVLQAVATAIGRGPGASGVPLGTEWNSTLMGGSMALDSVRSPEAFAGSRREEGHTGGGAAFENGSSLSTREVGNVDGSPSFVDANLMGTEDQVAEQVAYWVNQKTQNAQVTIDRDGQPVEVSVSLSGNEAHISFRSDQPETRALLDQSMGQLSDLLRSEGLVLSGMSVDTSAQNGAPGGRESRQSDGRQGARQAQVATQIPATSSLAVGGSMGTNRTVDVFV